MPNKATHIPYGLTDLTKRTIRNPGIKDEAELKNFGIEIGGEPPFCVPRHRHHTYGETFYPIKSEVGVVGYNGTKTMILKPDEPGNTYTVEPGEWHRFFNPSQTDDLIFDVKVQLAHRSFEKHLSIYYGIVSDGGGALDGAPKSLFHILMLMNREEVGCPGFGGWLSGVLAGLLGFIARVTGEEERLTRKYYGRPITKEERAKWKAD